MLKLKIRRVLSEGGGWLVVGHSALNKPFKLANASRVSDA